MQRWPQRKYSWGSAMSYTRLLCHHPDCISRSCTGWWEKIAALQNPLWILVRRTRLTRRSDFNLKSRLVSKCPTSLFRLQRFPLLRTTCGEICWVSKTAGECPASTTPPRRACQTPTSTNLALWVRCRTSYIQYSNRSQWEPQRCQKTPKCLS